MSEEHDDKVLCTAQAIEGMDLTEGKNRTKGGGLSCAAIGKYVDFSVTNALRDEALAMLGITELPDVEEQVDVQTRPSQPRPATPPEATTEVAAPTGQHECHAGCYVRLETPIKNGVLKVTDVWRSQCTGEKVFEPGAWMNAQNKERAAKGHPLLQPAPWFSQAPPK